MWPAWLFIGVCSALGLGAILILYFFKNIPLQDMVKDPNAVSGLAFHTGLLSQFGVFFWSAAASYALQAVIALRCWRPHPDRWFWIGATVLTVMLGMDDALLLHEDLMPRAGVDELWVFGFYGGTTLSFLLINWRTVLRTDYLILGVSLMCFAISMTVDLISYIAQPHFLLEDSFKFVGIVSWAVYFYRANQQSLQLQSLHATGVT